MKKQKLIPIPKLKKNCHDAWSLAVRARDKKCVMCGTTEDLQSHHCIVPSARGNSTRYLMENGVCLCKGCHLFKYHQKLGCRVGKEWYDQLSATIDKMVTPQRQDEIRQISHQVKKYNREELEQTIKDLLALAEKYKGGTNDLQVKDKQR